jgi:hypothetical protein
LPIKDMITLGCKKVKLRAHSDLFPNAAQNEWALSFLDSFDLQCECKSKNLGAEQLHNQAQALGLL